jgi:hypothetical protein
MGLGISYGLKRPKHVHSIVIIDENRKVLRDNPSVFLSKLMSRGINQT